MPHFCLHNLIRVMKLTLILLLISATSLFASEVNSQNAKVNITMKNVRTRMVLDEIEKQTDYLFLFNPDVIDTERSTSVSVKNRPVSEVLDKVFDETEVTYKVEGSSIILLKGAVSEATQTQKIRVSGAVIDNEGFPITGASVIEKGTGNGIITDINGNFTLDVAKNAVLQISYIGYVQQEISVTEGKNLTVTLVEDTQLLDEVVVVGYGTQRKMNLTGAISSIDSEILKDRPINSLSGGLQGVVPGLNITTATGRPGESTTVNVRGYTSINGGSPLILVDGVEMEMNMLNPSDIESVTVLKDAASSAIYGVRAAYGVVLITTKGAGEAEKTTVSYSGNFAISTPTIMPEFVENSLAHVNFMNMAMQNAGLANVYTQDQVNKIMAYRNDPYSNPEYEIIGGQIYCYGYRDWADMVLKDWTPSHRHNVSISGGSQKTKFYSSVGYVQQKGLYEINPDDFKRVNTRLVVENQTTKWLKLSMKALYNVQMTDEPFMYRQEPWYQLIFTSPVRPYIWEGDSRYPEYDQYAGMYFDDQNPVSLLDLGGREKKRKNDMWLTAGADIHIMKGWNARVDFSYNNKQENNIYDRKKVRMITAKFVPTEGHTSGNYFEERGLHTNYYSFNAYTEYEKTFAEMHYLKGMVGYNQELTKFRQISAKRMDMLSPELPALGTGIGDHVVSGTGHEWALRGGFFRLNYIYNDRYLLEVNGRYDGTSRFPKENRFVFLPSYSAGWRVSEEAFMERARSVLNNFKLRASYGELGNQLLTSSDWSGNTKYYPYIPFMTAGTSKNYLFNGSIYETTISPAGLVSGDLTWEKAATLNFGVDLDLLKNRLNTSFDWYQRTTSDMLTKVEYPELLGTDAPPANKAELRTRGWEFIINWRDKIGKDFSYDIGFVLSDSQAEITKYDNPSGTLTDHYVGKKLGEIWGYTTEGFFANKEEANAHADQSKLGSNWDAGDIKYKDLDGNGVVSNGSNTIDDHGDLKVIGNTTMRYTYGITGNFSYKGIFMNMFFQGVGKRDFWPSNEAFWPAATQWFAVQKWFVEDSWTTENQDTYFARPVARNSKNRQTQSRYIQDGSYLRLKNLTIGYDFSPAFVRKLHMSKLQVYLSGENLFEFTDVKGSYDPEAASKNGETTYPFQRVVSIGLNVTF